MKRLLPLIFLFLGMFASMAQQRPAWVPVPAGAGILPNKAAQRSGFPAEFKLFQLDLAPLRQAMMSVAGNNRSALRTVISLPTAAGKFEDFEIIESSNFHPDLQARFPNIRAYSGRSLTNPGSTLKISIDDRGIQGMVFRAGDVTEYLEPYSEDNRVYAAFRRQRPAGGAPWTCSTADQVLANGLQNRVSTMATTIGAGNVLRTMRLAQSCNAEYSNYFGAFSSADVAKVLAAFNATLTRCNGVYEKDLALHLNLIPTTDKVIYYVPSSDPYSTTISSWNNALQTTLTNNIGEANYDIGHMFGASGGGGNAGCIGCVCVDGSKGKGITSPADGIPQGDNFDIDYVVHEVGHQLGGNHTFSMSNEGT
ncbi:MAG: reprolysin-like metallopeptidase, partial [Bacteroidota bacterium]